MGLEKAKPRTSNERVDIGDIVDVYEFPKNVWTELRFLDTNPLSVSNHWIDIVTKAGEKKRFPKICVSWDSASDDDIEGIECPYCKAGINRVTTYYANAIVRAIQEEEPAKKVSLRDSEKETGFKDKDSKSWTPVRVIRLTSNLVAKIQGLKDLNLHKIDGKKVAKYVSDNKYGMDVHIKYDEKAANASNKYAINTSNQTPLESDERKYLVYDLDDEDLLKKIGQESEEIAKREMKSLSARGVGAHDEEEDDDYDLSDRKKSKRRNHEDDDDGGYGKKKRSSGFDDDEDDEPKSKKKSKPKYDDDDEEDDDEDFEPKSKKKSKSNNFEDDEPKSKKKSKSKYDDDEEDDDEDFEPKSKRKSEYDEEDDDEDFEPKSKKKSATKSKADSDSVKSKKSKSSDDEDEEDEDFEPKSKKKSKSNFEDDDLPKRRSRFEDDDEDEEDDD